MNKTVLAALGGLAALALVGAGVFALSGPSSERAHPNVLIVLWDTVRADRMSLYGYGLDTTPRMAAWAREHGMIFERAVSPGMWTVPSHASLFTGLPPSTHGAGNHHRWLDEHNLTLAEHFKANGYQTYAFSANPNLSPKRINLLQGIDHVDLSWGRQWKKKVVAHTRDKMLRRDASTEISPSNPGKKRGVGFYNAGPITHEAFTAFLDSRIAAQEERPFFAYLSYMEAHKPRVPALQSRQEVADKETIELGLATDLTFNSQLLYSYGKKSYTEAELEAINRVYDATLRDLDDATADLFADLEARGVLEDTVVVFTSDHGEQLGEHQLFGHRNGVYQALLHVPLVISYPRALTPTTISEPVSNLDIFNTLVHLTGVETPEGDYARGVLTDAARRASGAIFGESISIDKVGFNRVQAQFNDLVRDVWAHKYRAVILGDHKLIQTVSFDDDSIVAQELYQLSSDPHETHDLAADQPEKVADLARELERWREGLRLWDPQRADLDAAREAEGSKSLSDCKMLLQLGYTDGECEKLFSGGGDGGGGGDGEQAAIDEGDGEQAAIHP